MSRPRIGSLCSGYGGLDMGIQAVLGGHTVWVSDIDKGANKILAHRYPDVPNLGDFTALDWTTVEPIDVLTAGFPCQPVSNAGKQLGDEDERWLWDDVARAVRELRPGLVVLENVRGLLTAGAGRLFGRVVGTLADLGYDAQWHGLRAADVGAPHGRFRVFVAAYPASDAGRLANGDDAVAADAGSRAGWQHGRDASGAEAGANGRDESGRNGALLPTPRATDGSKGGPNQRGSSGDLMLPSAVALLPTPTVQHSARNSTAGRSPDAKPHAEGDTLADLVFDGRLLPTPSVADVQGGRKARSGDRNDEPLLNGIAAANLWGDYAAAITRWERALGRPAPAPTTTSSKGNPQLSPVFVEWLMGLPAGWVTDTPCITRNEALKALGNGVVPQQAAAALRTMLAWEAAA